MSEIGVQNRNEQPVRLELSLDRRGLMLLGIVAVQSAWLALIMLRGWYSGPDLGNLGSATGQPLNWDYLSQSLGGHFGPPGRLLFWTLNWAAPLNWELTVVIRLLLQAAATVLLWRLLERLVGERPWIPLVVVMYAVSPLLVPATAVFTNGIGVSIGQVCALAALLAHVRYTRIGRLRSGLTVPVLLLLGLCYSSQIPIVFLLLPLLSLGFLHTGSLADRLRQAMTRWPGWVALLGAGLLFLGVYKGSSGTISGGGFGVADAWHIARTEWLDVLGTSVVGGPWNWTSQEQVFAANASPPVVAVILGQLVLLVLVVRSVRTTGRRALLAWAIPVLVAIGGALMVGYARHDFLGVFIAPIYRYSYYVALAMALGVTLAFARTPEEQAGVRADRAGAPVHSRSAAALLPRVATVAFVLASLWSGLQFAGHFWDNPARSYVSNLKASVEKAGPGVNLYDTPVPPEVIPLITPNHYVSDVLRMTDANVRYLDARSEPLLASATGELVPADFYPVAEGIGPTDATCGTFVHGAGSKTVDLGPVSRAEEWFLRLQLYQPRPNTLTVEVRDTNGELLKVVGGSPNLNLEGTLVAVNRRLEFGVPASVTLRSTDESTNLCLVHVYIGGPFAKAVP